jgi:hypothetical protein
MKLIRVGERLGLKWGESIALYYDYRLRWENGKPVIRPYNSPTTQHATLIVSDAQAHALRNRALKQSLRVFAARDANTWVAKYRTLVNMRAMLEIKPGAAYFYAKRLLGTRKVSRVISPEVLLMPEQLVALNFQMRTEAAANSMVTMEKRNGLTIATYEKLIYAKSLQIIPKDCVERLKCLNG